MPQKIPSFRTRGAARRWPTLALLILAGVCGLFLAVAPAGAQNTPPTEKGHQQSPLPGDWAPELLYGIWNSPNPQAANELYRSAFAAGPAIVPQLQAALKDDRTATFAAQALAFIGGSEASKILATLKNDQRDLDLVRFYYGALGEEDTPQAERELMDAVRGADAEEDREVTEQAILALTARSGPDVAAELREAEKQVHDPVIRDDIESAVSVISARDRYLALRKAKVEPVSIDRAVHTYFIAALDPALTQPRSAGNAAPRFPKVDVNIQSLTFSPDHSRALAHVTFEDPSAVAEYDLVLKKKSGDWTLASVWLGPEYEKQKPQAPAKTKKAAPPPR